MNSILGSVVPLAMFSPLPRQLEVFFCFLITSPSQVEPRFGFPPRPSRPSQIAPSSSTCLLNTFLSTDIQVRLMTNPPFGHQMSFFERNIMIDDIIFRQSFDTNIRVFFIRLSSFENKLCLINHHDIRSQIAVVTYQRRAFLFLSLRARWVLLSFFSKANNKKMLLIFILIRIINHTVDWNITLQFLIKLESKAKPVVSVIFHAHCSDQPTFFLMLRSTYFFLMLRSTY